LPPASEIQSSTSGGDPIVPSLHEDDDEDPGSGRIDANSALSAGSDALSATSMTTKNTATASISKATSTLTAHASRSMGGLSKAVAKKGQVLSSSLKKSVKFNDDKSMLSMTSDSSAGKNKMSKIMKSAKLPGNIMKSKMGPNICGEICVPEEVSEDDLLKMPDAEESVKNSTDAAQNEDEDTTAQTESAIDSTSLDNVKEALRETENNGEEILQPTDTIDAGDSGSTKMPSEADQGDAADEIASNDSDDSQGIVTKVGNEEDGMNDDAHEEVHADAPMKADKEVKENDYNEGKRNEEVETPPEQSIITGADASSTPSVDDALYLANDNAELLRTLMDVKLELATARTENDHHRAKLKETEEERDFYKKKYNECMEGRSRDLQVPSWLADEGDEGSPRGRQQSRQQQSPSGGFKMNISNMTSPFRKPSP
jgi:hypothetical protein